MDWLTDLLISGLIDGFMVEYGDGLIDWLIHGFIDG